MSLTKQQIALLQATRDAMAVIRTSMRDQPGHAPGHNTIGVRCAVCEISTRILDLTDYIEAWR